MDKIMAINSTVNGIVWGIPMLILIVGTGIYMTVKLNFFQFRHFGYAMKNTIGKVLDKSQKVEAQKGAITPMQAVTTALAATVGTGNIVGVTGAIALGGPGAVFWMEISALLGMATKFSEVTLATKYREKNDKGDWVGGPMYYIRNGLGKKWAWLGGVFAVPTSSHTPDPFQNLTSFSQQFSDKTREIGDRMTDGIQQFFQSFTLKGDSGNEKK